MITTKSEEIVVCDFTGVEITSGGWVLGPQLGQKAQFNKHYSSIIDLLEDVLTNDALPVSSHSLVLSLAERGTFVITL